MGHRSRLLTLLTLVCLSFALGGEPLRVLFVGDSMVEAVFRPSGKLCKERSYRCEFLFKRGLRTDAWTSGGYALELLFKLVTLRPDAVVVSSGTNDLYADESNERVYEDFRRLVTLIKSVGRRLRIRPKVIVVAPPIPNDRGLNEFLAERLGREEGVWVMQSKVYRFELWDGVHPTAESSKVWAEEIIRLVDRIR
ncbi:MAG: SGNH/GDSL hydrolase family protein [Aquificae bacterium]|nr:SGNH/GDSL hydrolase family protein [Aquificota bacterium]